jgi:hypothetical protein
MTANQGDPMKAQLHLLALPIGYALGRYRLQGVLGVIELPSHLAHLF